MLTCSGRDYAPSACHLTSSGRDCARHLGCTIDRVNLALNRDLA